MEDAEEREIIVQKYVKGRDKLDKSEIFEWEDPQNELYHITDRYGFIHGARLPERLSEYEEKLQAQELSRLGKWVKMLRSWEQFYPHSEKLHSRTYKGIPNRMRCEVWKRLLEVPTMLSEQQGKYQEMLNYGLECSKDIRQIDLDVNRTYRNHLMFRERYNTKQQMLFKILVAYSVYNTEIGYCQGMSQIAALLLMYMDEEDAFWSLSSLMSGEKHAMHGFFIPGFPKLHRFASHHDKIIKKLLPRLYKHFKKYEISSTLYTLKWFFQCFLDRVPFSLTLRLWDCFLFDGDIILTGMSYTLLKLHKKTLLKMSMEQTIEFLQIHLEKDFGYHDDSAINALKESIQELKRHRLLYPAKPNENELPTKPFGLVSHERLSACDEDQSLAGSVRLKLNDSHSVATSRTSEVGSQVSLYENVTFSDSLKASKSPSRLEASTSNEQPKPTIDRDFEIIDEQMSSLQNEIHHLSSNLQEKLSMKDTLLVRKKHSENVVLITAGAEQEINEADKTVLSNGIINQDCDNDWGKEAGGTLSHKQQAQSPTSPKTRVIQEISTISYTKHVKNEDGSTVKVVDEHTVKANATTIEVGDDVRDGKTSKSNGTEKPSSTDSPSSATKIRIYVPYKDQNEDGRDRKQSREKAVPVIET